ncbi:flagellar hook assembly protein FlgD [Oleisolibacter albus]|uniref:flagellar hook assembly protein FlgD n=1 Tax=Oleisolibacter albus TaxID=2171757 RepID=UPI000DF1190C|nr:flagellar hook capping FlgD N-terminal domain-containing protein [Oleisolibacter albus]
MTVTAANTTPPAGTSTGTTSGTTKTGVNSTGSPMADLTKNYDMFLTLLTAQLKNQDPLQPQETSEFTNQLVQFSQVEQQISSNKKLDDINSAINNGRPGQAISYIGRTVEVVTQGVALQEGRADMSVNLATDAESATMTITNPATGKVVRTIPLKTKSGIQDVPWDGKNDKGEQLADGTYKAEVIAKDKDGKAVSWSMKSTGKVTGVDLTDSTPYLMIGSLPAQMDQVIAVR